MINGNNKKTGFLITRIQFILQPLKKNIIRTTNAMYNEQVIARVPKRTSSKTKALTGKVRQKDNRLFITNSKEYSNK